MISPALAAFYDDCTYWANFAREKEKAMTLTIEVAPDVAADLEASARAKGQTLPEYVVVVLHHYTRRAAPENPLARALAMVEARDAQSGPVVMRTAGVDDAATEIRQIREARTP